MLGFGNEPKRVFEAHCERHAPGYRKPDVDLASHELGGKQALPIEKGEEVASLHQSHGAGLDPSQSLLSVARRYGMLDGVGPKLIRGVPAIGTPM